MKKEEYLNRVTSRIYYIFDRNSIEAELKEHLEDSIQNLMEEGYSYEEAEEQAVLKMGDPVETGKMLNKEHHPVAGYLYAVSKVLMILAVIYFVYTIGCIALGFLDNISPVTVANPVATYSVNKRVDIPTHKLILDEIHLSEKGYYLLTVRAWTKLTYSRSGWSVNYFEIYDSEGGLIGWSGQSSSNGITSKVVYDFERPKDDILVLELRDGKVLRLDLKEYIHEEK